MKDVGRAIEMMNTAHKLDMECAEYPQALSVLHSQVGNLTDSIFFAKLSTALKPNKDFPALLPVNLTNFSKIMTNPSISTSLVSAMYAYNSRKFDKSVENCITEISVSPGNLEAQRLLGKSLYQTAKYERAVATLHSVIHQDPGKAEDQAILGKILIALGRAAEALACLKAAHDMNPTSVEVHSAVMSGLDQLGETATARKIAQLWNKAHKRKKKKGLVEPLEGRPIRLGYVSDSFYHCDIAKFIEPLIKYHNREKFEVYCYQNFLVKDSLSYSMENN
ncbi:MAG: tetratricopeptide repeat protein, partial [Rhodospirillaceae bacterium]|nr:tetratricopeptide repeat protein [Rhodospirillaceae bacterium]